MEECRDAAGSEPVFSIVQDPSSRNFAALYAIYESALPSSERKSRRVLEEMIGRSDYRFIVARVRDEIAGFAILFIAQTARIGLLEYLAVDEQFRGLGLGAALFERGRRWVTGGPASRALLIEVEADLVESPERELRARRKNFYRRLGCRELTELRYIMPLQGRGTPPAMDLMVWFSGNEISREQLRAWLVAVYEEVYGCGRDDPRIDQMITRECYELS